MIKASLEDLVKAGAHYGHQSKRWNPKMAEYIHGKEEDVHIFDLFKTKEALDEALSEITKASKEGKKILIVGTKKQAKEKVEEIAKGAGIMYVNERWLGGTLTNFEQIKNSLRKMSEMKTSMEIGEYKSYTKKERLLIDREIARLERFFGGISKMDGMPDLMLIVDVKREAIAAKEARQVETRTIGIVDTNSDPESVDLAIPMNDDAARTLEYVLDLFYQALLEGKGKKIAKKEKSTETETKPAKKVKKTTKKK